MSFGGAPVDAPLLRVRNLRKVFVGRRGFIGGHETVAVDGVSFDLCAGTTTALVGESGSGKTTLATMLLGLSTPTSGQVEVAGRSPFGLRGEEARAFRRQVQVVFQDPYASLSPRMTIGEALQEPLWVHRIAGDSRTQAIEILRQVGLAEDAMSRYPHEFSGGQRQRIAIARALILEPQLLILDEPTSALDMSVQSGILNLLAELQSARRLTYLLITHNLDLVGYLADHVLVMDQGKIVEEGPVEQVLDSPSSEPTRRLLAAQLP